MKKSTTSLWIVLLTFVAGTLFSGFMLKKNKTKKNKKMAQVGIIVGDIDKAAEKYAALFNMDKPDIIIAENPEDNPTTYKGELTEATAKLAFFNLENIQLELIEPVGKPSTWNKLIKKTGGGIHHIAFWIDGMKMQVSHLESLGMKAVQHGGWTGGQYSYVESEKDMAVIIELLENFND